MRAALDEVRRRVDILQPGMQVSDDDILKFIVPNYTANGGGNEEAFDPFVMYDTASRTRTSSGIHETADSNRTLERTDDKQLQVWDPDHHRQLQGDEAACVVEVVAIIVEVVSFALCAITSGLCGVGRKVGQAVARKARSDARKKIMDEVKDLGGTPSDEAAAGAVFQLFGNIVETLSLSAIMDAIGANIAWYEWIVSQTECHRRTPTETVSNAFFHFQVIGVGLFFEILALLVSGGALFIVKLLSMAVNLGLLINAIVDVVQACDGVDRIGCASFTGYDFFEQRNSFRTDLWSPYSDASFQENANRCTEAGGPCKAFNTAGYLKIALQYYDEWITYPSSSSCQGLFVKRGIDVCRRDLPGYVYYEDYESSSTNLVQIGGGSLVNAADECNSRADGCQGFNTAGFLKAAVGSVDTWSKYET